VTERIVLRQGRRTREGGAWRFTIYAHGLDASTLDELAAALTAAGFDNVAVVDYDPPRISLEIDCGNSDGVNWTRRLNELVSGYCDFDYAAVHRTATERANEAA
jgi:hypothetical protein